MKAREEYLAFVKNKEHGKKQLQTEIRVVSKHRNIALQNYAQNANLTNSLRSIQKKEGFFMGNLLDYIQLAIGLAGLYLTIYLALKAKYEKLWNINPSDKQNRLKCSNIAGFVELLNTITIILAIIIITLYFPPFKGFFHFFKESNFNTPQGKIIYILSSSISFLILTFWIVKDTFFDDLNLYNAIYQYLFFVVNYIYSIIALLKLNQFALTYFLKLYENSYIYMFFAICMTHFIMIIILLTVNISSSYGYTMLIDFLSDKFTEKR